MKNKNIKPNIQIQFPNLLLIPVISIIGSIVKICGGTSYDWLHILITIPIIVYFLWCISFCIVAVLFVIIAKFFVK